jgi:LysM repeat protein
MMSRALLLTRPWLVLAAITILLVASPAFAQSGPGVRVNPATVAEQVNATFTVSIDVENVTNLTAFEAHLQFNPAVLEVLQVTNGGFVAADFVAQNVFDNTAGTIDYAVAQMNRPPAQGNGTLMTVTLRAKANGSSTLALRPTAAAPSGLLLADQDGASIQAAWVNGNVVIGATATPTSAPATETPATATSTPVTSEPVTATATATPTVTEAPPTEVTVTSTPTPIVTPIPTGGTLGIHKVRWGETLYCIGRAYQVEPYAIAKANGIWWPNIIFPGQKLTIPNTPWGKIPAGPVCKTQFVVAPGTPAQPTPTATPVSTIVAPTSTPASCRAYHTVRSGETLYRIGVNYGVSYVEIAIVNGIADPRLIYAGQKLCIP